MELTTIEMRPELVHYLYVRYAHSVKPAPEGKETLPCPIRLPENSGPCSAIEEMTVTQPKYIWQQRGNISFVSFLTKKRTINTIK